MRDLHRVLGEHVVDGDVLADVAQELQVADAAEPVGVVRPGSPGWRRYRTREAAKLRADARRRCGERRVVEQVALDDLARRIADHAGRAADDGDRLVPRALEPRQHDHRHQVADVQRLGRRVVAGVERDRAGVRGASAALARCDDVRDQPAGCRGLPGVHALMSPRVVGRARLAHDDTRTWPAYVASVSILRARCRSTASSPARRRPDLFSTITRTSRPACSANAFSTPPYRLAIVSRSSSRFTYDASCSRRAPGRAADSAFAASTM